MVSEALFEVSRALNIEAFEQGVVRGHGVKALLCSALRCAVYDLKRTNKLN